MGDTGEVRCCVCNLPIQGEASRLGGRFYDKAHYSRVSLENRAAARPIFVLIVALASITGLVYFSTLLFPAGSTAITGLPFRIAATLLAILPAGIWLIAFYRLDRLEPEPKEYVLGVFVLGAVLAVGIGQPFIDRVFQLEEWQHQSAWITMLGAILCVGFVQEFLKYAAVRYTVFRSAEFDERVDGIIYAAAAGLGYATALNLTYVSNISALAVGAGAAKMAVQALGHATYAGIMGSFLSKARFELTPRWWLPVGLTLASVLNGVVTTLLLQVGTFHTTIRDSAIHHWLRLGLAALIALGIYFVLFRAIRKLNAERLAQD